MKRNIKKLYKLNIQERKIALICTLFIVAIIKSILYLKNTNEMLKCENIINIENSNNEETYEVENNGDVEKYLLIIMYHSVVNSNNNIGKYIISKSMLYSDVKYLINEGYSFINAKDLVDYMYNNKNLPDGKLVMLTFDDGHYNFYTNVMPTLKELGAKSTVAVVGSYIYDKKRNDDKSDKYSYMDLDTLKEVSKDKNVSIINHSYDYHTIDSKHYGAMKDKYETVESYKVRFLMDTLKVEEIFELNRISHTSFYAFPFGGASKEGKELIKNVGILGSLSCVEGINKITRNEECLYNLFRYNRSGLVTTSDFFRKIFS